MGKQYGIFDAAISLDVIEHIFPQFEGQYFDTILRNLSPQGICIIGTPNRNASPYASIPSQIGHVNLYSQEKLVEAMLRYFHQVLSFGMNDEILHTGYGPMCHYLLCVGCVRRSL
jgi:2-polyprenyl-3-methyl-5-hydroxy-6-metoxy-1,4-benzoquinol methylase